MNKHLVAGSINNIENEFVGYGVKIKFVSNLALNTRHNPVLTGRMLNN